MFLGRERLLNLLNARIRVVTVLAWLVVAVGLYSGWSTLESLWDDRRSHIAAGQEPGGALIICGGGEVPDEIERRFVRLAGGPSARLVIIPTAHYEADEIDPLDTHIVEVLRDWRARGVASVEFLHTRDRAVADSEEFVEPLLNASGIWIEGGDQEWLTAPYVNTLFEDELHRLLERGGVIGGNSAGAACMTRVMIAAGHVHPRDGEGFDLFPGAVIDQHFLKRNRLNRLRGFLGRHPGLVGIGIDERTALEVRIRDMQLTVIGDSYVVAYIPESPEQPARFEVLQSGDVTDLAKLREGDAPVATVADTEETPPAGSVN